MRTTTGWIACGALLASMACSSGGTGSGSNGSSTQPANPCATKNATYLEMVSQQPGGTCGQVNSQVINVNADGTITLPTTITCASLTVTGCTTRGSDCTYTSNGDSFTENFETTFAQDGSSATGVLSISGMGNGASCSSTYDMTATRQ